jgi:hypothetical protein
MIGRSNRGSGATPLFVELCAGTAALSLALHGEGARPPMGWNGRGQVSLFGGAG